MTENDPNRYVGSVYVWDEKKVKEIMQDIVNFTKQNDKMMDYEKKYKEALERAKEFYILCKKCGAKDTVDFLENTFSELKESEDEKIRNLCEELVRTCFMNELCTKEDKDECIAWLEKQGEQKPVDFKAKDWYVSKVDGKIHNMTYNPTDKVEPNPTWSEADERNLKSIMKIIKEKAFADYDVDEDNNMLGIYGILESWLKSLKERLKGE